jgi:hypothetical protein
MLPHAEGHAEPRGPAYPRFCKSLDYIWYISIYLCDISILSMYISVFNQVIVLFDNDKAGIPASNKVVKYINNHYSSKAISVVLPFDDNSVDEIRAHHIFEHLDACFF